MEYIEHTIVFIIFLLALRYLRSVFSPNKAGGCSKGCGSKCAVGHLEKAMEQFEEDNASKKMA